MDLSWANWSDLPWYKKAVVGLIVLWKACAWKLKFSWKGKHMEKPFDIAELKNRLAAKSLNLAEDEARLVVEETLGWVQDSVIATPNKLDDLSVPVLGILKPLIMKEVDKIDGQVG